MCPRRSSSGSASLVSINSLTFCPPGTVYLKALHPYDPEPEPIEAASVDRARCLPLRANTIIYVHSVHASGWADGTLLSGERGWIPANYCEPYTFSLLLPLTQSKDDLTNATRRARSPEYTDIVASVVSCVRQLLIETECLTRDSSLVRQYDTVRRDRKFLLAELAALVALARQEASNIGDVAQHLVERSERILSRAGRFVHTIGPITSIYSREDARAHLIEITPTPPISFDFSIPTISEEEDEASLVVQNRGQILEKEPKTFSASKHLESSHDCLLSHLAAFIGRLHLQTQIQSTTHILLATRQCVNAARALLASLESICSYHADRTLSSAKDHLYTDITKLVTRAHDVVGSSDGVVFETHRLVEAATGVVRGAGLCTARAFHLLDIVGDFPLPQSDNDEVIESLSIRRDNTSSSLASSLDHRQSRDVQAQVEDLAIPYKKVAALSPRKVETLPNENTTTIMFQPTTGVVGCSESLTPTESLLREFSTFTFNEENLEIMLNQDGQVIGATLASLVERMTLHDCMPDPVFSSSFYLTFRLFAKPTELAEMLISRYTWTLNRELTDVGWSMKFGTPIRLRVYNVFKGWLESHWRSDQDSVALPMIDTFANGVLMDKLPQAGKRLADMVVYLQSDIDKKLISLVGKTTTAVAHSNLADAPAPPPLINKAQIANLRASALRGPLDGCQDRLCCIVDFDDLEVARQLTILESRIYCAITPVELVGQEFSKKMGVSLATNVKAMSAASTDIAGWVADSILSETEQKKRTQVLKHWIKVGERCAQINNFNSLMAIMCALNSSTISRLKRTWDGLTRSQRTSLDHLRSITDHQRNYAVYRSKVRQSNLPCLPFLGLYLTDLVFIDEGNPSHRPSKNTTRSLINFDKHSKTAKIITEFQHTQMPYKFQEVPELSAWILSSCLRMRKSATDLSGNLWRKSLVIEPKLPVTMKREPSTTSSVDSESWSNRKLSFLSSW